MEQHIYEFETKYLRCPECLNYLYEIRFREERGLFTIDELICFECPNCKERFSKCEYVIDNNEVIKYYLFK